MSPVEKWAGMIQMPCWEHESISSSEDQLMYINLLPEACCKSKTGRHS